MKGLMFRYPTIADCCLCQNGYSTPFCVNKDDNCIIKESFNTEKSLDMSDILLVNDVEKKYGDTDGDVFSGKYEIVACIGDEHDYTRECVDVTNRWKDARNAFFAGADVYKDGKRVYFIDHKEMEDAFQTLKMYYIMMGDQYFWEDGLNFEDEVRIKDAQDVLSKYGFELDTDGWPDKEWVDKIMSRSPYINDPLTKPFCERNPKAVPVYTADTHKLVRVESARCEDDELPF